MLRLRICALVLAVVTLFVAVWAWVDYATAEVSISLLFAAMCLAVVAPFDATEPRRRWRVSLACLVYVGAIAAAIIWAYNAAAPGLITGALVLLAQTGLGLTLWALAIRKRQKTPFARRYYDN